MVILAMKVPPTPPFSAVLLAGGQSRRMGRDKAGLLCEGKPLWRRQLDTLRATGAEEVLISGRADGPYSASGCKIVTDDASGCGPLAGIAAALRAARSERLLVLAIDLPAMQSDFLVALVRESITCEAGVVPQDECGFQPLAAVFTRDCLPLAMEHLRSEDRSLQRFIVRAEAERHIVARRLAAGESALFRNLNTPEEFTAYCAESASLGER